MMSMNNDNDDNEKQTIRYPELREQICMWVYPQGFYPYLCVNLGTVNGFLFIYFYSQLP